MKEYVKGLYRLFQAARAHPRMFKRALAAVPSLCSAYSFARKYAPASPEPTSATSLASNPVWEYFQNHRQGPGIWKWEHYFDIYHRHFARFVGKQVNVLEVGIYSGGSLGMWRAYFGDSCHVYGVDIEAACKAYENDHVSVFIGDQADRGFWNTFRESVEGVDILIDDGGHTLEQQQATLEAMLPALRPGGVYLCEDVHGSNNRFGTFASGLINELNCWNSDGSQFQSSIHSIHFYPYIVVIEKHGIRPRELVSVKQGTEWQPFL